VREEQGELILKTSQPKGQSGLPLAAEMILRAIAEQVETLANSQMHSHLREHTSHTPQSQELMSILSEFTGKLTNHFQNVHEASQLNRSVESQWGKTTKGLREAFQTQRAFQSKLKSTAAFLSSQVRHHAELNNTLEQMNRSAELIASEFQNSKGKPEGLELAFTRLTDCGLQLLSMFETLESEHTEATVEFNRLRANDQKTNSAWASIHQDSLKNTELLNHIVQMNESLKPAIHHLHLLAVNTGLEAARSDLQESGLSFIASDIKKVAEKFESTQRDLSQRLLTLREYSNETISQGESLIQKSKHKFEIQPDTKRQCNSFNKEAVRNEFRDEIAKFKLSSKNLQTSSTHSVERESLLLIKSLKDYQHSFSKETHAIKQLVSSLNSLSQDEARYEETIESLRCDHETLRSLRKNLSNAIESLKLSVENLESECAAVKSATECEAMPAHFDAMSESQVSEINEQLKQCAQEIFNLVDTPDRSLRAAS
jgi:chromosome segregation ATPase